MSSANVDAAALASCDQEPIHVPGTIQNFGCLLAVNCETEIIEVASKNTPAFLEIEAHDLIGQSIATVLDHELMHALRNIGGYSSVTVQREHVGILNVHGGTMDVAMHQMGRHYQIEFLPQSEVPVSLNDIRSLVGKLQRAESLQQVFAIAVEAVADVSKYHRVMFYRFLPDGAGEVVAEERDAEIDSFLGLRYPAWDIPLQARALYVKTPIRIIQDMREDSVPLVSLSTTPVAEFDMSLALLRGTSPVHLEYMNNMGVKSTMTIPIVVDKQLWGLIACHHNDVRQVDPSIVSSGELAGQVVSLAVNQLLERMRQEIHRQVTDLSGRVIRVQEPREPALEFGRLLLPKLSSMITCHGCALLYDQTSMGLGVLQDRDECIAQIGALADKSTSAILTYASLVDECELPPSTDIAGALVIRIAAMPSVRLVFVRSAIESTINWGGNPEKELAFEEGEVRLSPRKSFAKYVTETNNKCDEWTAGDLLLAETIKRVIAESFETSLELSSQRANLGLMVHELNHRVRNILALVRSVTNQTKASADTKDRYAEGVEQRILALASAHDLLTSSPDGGLSLQEIARIELTPYLDEERLAEAISGDDVFVTRDAAAITSLLIHELVSNAVKYGALSVQEGMVSFYSALEGEEVVLAWRESSGPAVRPPERRGFGLTLLEQGFPYEFSTQSDLRFLKEGFEAHYRLPLRLFVKQASDSEGTKERPTVILAVPRTSALIVEDSYMLAVDLTNLLKELQFQEVERAATVENAIALIEEKSFDYCFLDINLRGESSFPVADRLMAKGMNFCFVSGYGVSADCPDRFKDVPIFQKPLGADQIERYLGTVMREAGDDKSSDS